MRICEVEGCDNKHDSKGYCNKHRMRVKRHGDVQYSRKDKGCQVVDCDGKHFGKGLCCKHYKRNYRYGDTDTLLKERHAMRRTPEYSTWSSMKSRCYNKNNQDYKYYGGRGIIVCYEWKNSFTQFYKDMGNKPEGLSIDRIDNDGNYEPSNCRWATDKEQSSNRRRHKNQLSLRQEKDVSHLLAVGFYSYSVISKIYSCSRQTIGNINK